MRIDFIILLIARDILAIIAAVLFVFAIGVPIAGFLFFRDKKRSWEARKKRLMVEMTHNKELMQAKFDVQEETFRNIAAEIHDNIGQQLSMAHYLAGSLVKQGVDAQNICTIIDKAINDLRSLSHGLSVHGLLEKGLGETIRQEILKLNKARKINAEFVDMCRSGIDEGKTIILFRVFQEAVQNIIRHSKADRVNVFLGKEEDCLQLAIMDNGIGMAPGATAGNGIKNMRARLKTIAGNLEITTGDTGTSLLIKIPHHERM